MDRAPGEGRPKEFAAPGGRDGANSRGESVLRMVATPIGHLGDLTFRARDALVDSDLILAEDTRTTGVLLKHYDIRTPMRSVRAANEAQVDYAAIFRDFRRVALVTDAGTPGISDPGSRAAAWCHAHGIRVEPLPGPSAVTALLSASGFVFKEFLFMGFLPIKKGKRRRLLTEALEKEPHVLVFYESPHRILDFLRTLSEIRPEIEVCLGREVTKKFEEILRKNAKGMLESFDKRTIRGEFVLAIDNRPSAETSANEADDPDFPDVNFGRGGDDTLDVGDGDDDR